MKLEELRKLEECPEWIKKNNVVVENESVNIVNGIFTWESSTWKNGLDENGSWLNGIWEMEIK